MGHENMTDDPDELKMILKLLDRKIVVAEERVAVLRRERELVRAKIEKLKGPL